MAESYKYLRHLTPVFIAGWQDNIMADLVSVCKDKELPEWFRHKLKMELKEIARELTVLQIKYGGTL